MANNQTRAALYIRVSTAEQAKEGYSVGVQEERLRSLADARGWNVVKAYVDPGHSGGTIERPAMQELIHDAEKGLLDVVAVYKLDRLSRRQKDTLHLIEDVFTPNGVSFVSLSESFDTSTPFGMAMVGILSVFAQLEREQIKERTMMGRLERAKEGYWHGGGGQTKVVTGYDYVDGLLVPNDYEAAAVKWVFDTYVNTGMGDWRIFEEALTRFPGVFGHEETIRAVLVNPVYKGCIRYQGSVYPGVHKALVDEDTFERAQEIRQSRVKNHRSFEKRHLLTGRIRCAKCGNTMHVSHSGKRKDGSRVDYYICRTRHAGKKIKLRFGDCKKKAERKEVLEDAVIRSVKALDIDKMTSEKIGSDEKATMMAIEKEVSKIDGQISKLVDLYSVDGIPLEMMSEKMEALNKKKNLLTAQLDKLNGEQVDMKPIHEVVKRLPGIDWNTHDIVELREILAVLIDCIIVDDGKMSIRWNFRIDG